MLANWPSGKAIKDMLILNKLKILLILFQKLDLLKMNLNVSPGSFH